MIDLKETKYFKDAHKISWSNLKDATEDEKLLNHTSNN